MIAIWFSGSPNQPPCPYSSHGATNPGGRFRYRANALRFGFHPRAPFLGVPWNRLTAAHHPEVVFGKMMTFQHG